LVEVVTSPLTSTAAQKVVVGQETPASLVRPLTLAAVHAEPLPVGSVDVTALPRLSTATHSELDGHDTELSRLGRSCGAFWSTSAGSDQLIAPEASAGDARAAATASRAVVSSSRRFPMRRW
jgi:hypothetical protein